MQLSKDISLKKYNTFGIDVRAKYFYSVETIEQLITLLKSLINKPKFILGGGSNLLLTKNIDAHVIYVNTKGIKVISDNKTHVNVSCAAGEEWHDFVLWTLEKGYGGIENLSLIPGKTGTAPIQNIGAYGVELKDVFVSCEAVERETLKTKTFRKEDCNFGYRDSVFKNDYKDKYVITSVTLKLTKSNHTLNYSYGAIKQILEKSQINTPSINDISNAVIKIRKDKLPNPSEIGNSGSFFKNPIISLDHFKKLKSEFSDIPSYPINENEVKVPAGWLIEKAGFKGLRLDNYGVHTKQALVLVNFGGASGQQISDLSRSIQEVIKKIFKIDLIAEVNII
jgi:UDP-N-acetylmuramate dehydrogenase